MHIHHNLESLYKYIPMECLPRDYLPDDYDGPSQGKLDDIIGMCIQRVNNYESNHYFFYISIKQK